LPHNSENRVVTAADGFPLFLDLSVQRFVQIASRRTPAANEFLVSFDVLAVRVLRDLTPTEQYALLACCLFDAFDKQLIHQTAMTRTSGSLNGLFDKSLIQLSGRRDFKFQLHSSLRKALLGATELGEYQMDRDDWRKAGLRAMDAIKFRLTGSIGYEQNFLILQAFQIAISLGIDDQYLVALAQQLVIATNWQPEWRLMPLTFGSGPPESQHDWPARLAQALTIIMGRQRRPRSQVAGDLERILYGDKDGAELDLVRYFLAESLRDVGDVEGADKLVDQLIRREGEWGARALHARVHLLRRRGQFRTAMQTITDNRRVLRHADRLLGDIQWTQASFRDAQSHYEKAALSASSSRSTGEEATCWASHAFASAWLEPNAAHRSIVLSDQALEGNFHSFTYLMNILAEILICAEDSPSAERCYRLLVQESQRLEQSSLTAYAHLARAFGGAVRNDQEVLRESLARSRESSSNLQFQYLSVIISQWSGEPDNHHIEWLDTEALDRWTIMPALRRGQSGGRIH
jgi:hypothetical protein